MYQIRTLNKISPIGLAVLSTKNYKVDDEVENPDAILVRSAKMHDYPINENLQCIARAGAGTNNIPLDKCAEAGIVVFNSPGANSESVKELAVCAMLMASRDVLGGVQWVQGLAADGEDVAALVEKGKSKFAGPELMGKTLGVIGLGAIGAKLANAALSMGMRVFGHDPYLSVQAAWGLSSEVQHAENLEKIYKNCDYISIHVPYMEATHEMINKDTIAMMKDGVRIINLARGELVSENDILAALEGGKVGKYVTDFPTTKLASQKNVIPIPHLGASTPESEDNCAIMAAQEIDEYLKRGNIRNSVNFPSAYMEPSGAARICVLHRNIPAIISGILKHVSEDGLNVENMVNKSKDSYSYCMIDVNGSVSDTLAEKISQGDGVLRVRVIAN